MNIADLRKRLVDLRAEQHVIKCEMDQDEARLTLTVTGKNAEERKAQLTLALATDAGYATKWNRMRFITKRIEELEAAIEDARDARREREWAIRLRLVEALERRGLSDNGRDSGFDEAADDDLADAAWENANGTYNGTVPSDHMSNDPDSPYYAPGWMRKRPVEAPADEVPF